MMRRDPPIRVLVVEDDAEAASELAELLEAHRAEAGIALSPAQAIAAAAALPPDVVLIDLELGTASGIDLASHWCGQPGSPAVILLSGRELTPAERARFTPPAPPLLRKPLDLAALLATVNRLLP